MSSPVKFLSSPHAFWSVPTDLVRPHLDLAPHFKPAGLNFQSVAASSGFGALGGASYTLAHQGPVAPQHALHAHLQALGSVVERRWNQAQAALMENAALVSYALPLLEPWLPQPLMQARQDLHRTLTRMADTTRAGLRALDELHPLNVLSKSLLGESASSPVISNLADVRGAMGDYLQARSAQVGDWLKSEQKFTPAMTAWLADSLLGVGLFAMTKKVSPNPGLGAALDIEKIPGNQSKTFYRVKGSKVELSLQRDVTVRAKLALNVKDLKISLAPDKSPMAYELLQHVIKENAGHIKMVSATVPVDDAVKRALLKAAGKPIKAGPLKDTLLGQMLQAEGLGGKVSMISRPGKTASGKQNIELTFTRS